MLNAGSGYSTLGVGRSADAGREGSDTSITGGGGTDGDEGDAADESELDKPGSEDEDAAEPGDDSKAIGSPRRAAAYETEPLLVRRGGTGRLGVGAVSGGDGPS